jgi:hypothetical protein
VVGSEVVVASEVVELEVVAGSTKSVEVVEDDSVWFQSSQSPHVWFVPLPPYDPLYAGCDGIISVEVVVDGLIEIVEVEVVVGSTTNNDVDVLDVPTQSSDSELVWFPWVHVPVVVSCSGKLWGNVVVGCEVVGRTSVVVVGEWSGIDEVVEGWEGVVVCAE